MELKKNSPSAVISRDSGTLNNRWRIHFRTFQDDRLQLTLFSIPSHHELYELGDMYIRNVDWNVDFLVSDDALDTFEGQLVFQPCVCPISSTLGATAGQPMYFPFLSELTSDLEELTLNDIAELAEVESLDEFTMEITLTETSQCEEPTTPTTVALAFGLAEQLTDPKCGDVILVARDENDIPQQLYAWSWILSANSEYFAARLSTRWRQSSSHTSISTSLEPHVDTDMSNNSDDTLHDIPAETANNDRHVISFEAAEHQIDYLTLHNILYFSYTGSANLFAGDRHSSSHPKGFPPPAEPFSLYRNSEKFLLDRLKERCFQYFKATNNTVNIAERLFHVDCCHHDGLRELFMEFLLRNYNAVKETKGWEKVVLEDGNGGDEEAMKYGKGILLEITRRLIVGPDEAQTKGRR